MRTRWLDETRLNISGDRATARREDSATSTLLGGVPTQQGGDAAGRTMNKLESRYAQYLQALKFGGEIRDWRFESVKLQLADSCTYRPDFLIVGNDGHVEYHECKGFFRDDAKVKIKVAAAMFPWWPFKVIRWGKGRWEVQTI